MPSPAKQDIVLDDFLDRIAPLRPNIRSLVLFGSRARGTQRLDSDYDLLIAVDQKDDAFLDGLYEAVMDVLLAHGRLVSLKVFTQQEFARLKALGTPFMQHVEKEGIVLG